MTEWKAAGRAHRAEDDRLWAQFRAAQDVFFNARNADNERKDAEFEKNATAKQALLDEYDSRIDPAADLDRARTLLRELEDRWDAIGFVPRGRVAEFDAKIGALESRVTDYADAQWKATDPEVQARIDQFRAKVTDLTEAAEAAEKAGKTTKAAELRAQAAQWSEWADAAAGAVEN
jgi:chromosome segregation ATPase